MGSWVGVGSVGGMNRTLVVALLSVALSGTVAASCGGSDSSSSPTTARQKNAALPTTTVKKATTTMPKLPGRTVAPTPGSPTTCAPKATVAGATTVAPQTTIVGAAPTTTVKSGC